MTSYFTIIRLPILDRIGAPYNWIDVSPVLQIFINPFNIGGRLFSGIIENETGEKDSKVMIKGIRNKSASLNSRRYIFNGRRLFRRLPTTYGIKSSKSDIDSDKLGLATTSEIISIILYRLFTLGKKAKRHPFGTGFLSLALQCKLEQDNDNEIEIILQSTDEDMCNKHCDENENCIAYIYSLSENPKCTLKLNPNNLDCENLHSAYNWPCNALSFPDIDIALPTC